MTRVARPRFSQDGPAPDRALARAELVAASARAELVKRVGIDLEVAPLPGNTAKDLAGPLAYRAMRYVEHALGVLCTATYDRDERVALTAARWIVQAAPKVAALSPPDAPPSATPEEKDAALRAAFESPEFCTLLVRVVSSPDGGARAALVAAGWLPPDA